MPDESPLDTGSLRLEMTVPSDARFRPILTRMCEHVAGLVGYDQSAATALGGEVAQTVTQLLTEGAPPPTDDIGLVVVATADVIEFRLRVGAAASHTVTKPLPGEH